MYCTVRSFTAKTSPSPPQKNVREPEKLDDVVPDLITTKKVAKVKGVRFIQAGTYETTCDNSDGMEEVMQAWSELHASNYNISHLENEAQYHVKIEGIPAEYPSEGHCC